MRITTDARPKNAANAWVAWMLHSPLHGLLDRSTMLISVTGRRTGTRFTIPVNYVRDGEAFIVLSQADRTWWRNARDTSVTLFLQNCTFAAHAHVIEQPSDVANVINDLVLRLPEFRRFFNIHLDQHGHPDRPDRLRRLIENRVIVRITDLAPLGNTPTKLQ